MVPDPSRRAFLKNGALIGGGLILGFALGFDGEAAAQATSGPFAPNAFLRILPDDTITVIVGKTELGQGVFTSLPMLVAEELDADWKMVKFESAPVDPAYNSTIAPFQFTGGSLSVWTSFEQLRTAGATAKAMLLGAAAKKWGVPEGECRAFEGAVYHDGSGRRETFGQLSALAATMPRPEKVTLKDPNDFRLIGKPTRRLDSAEKVDGTSLFGLDVKLPGLMTAVVLRSPVFGGSLKDFNAEKALKVPGVVKVERVPSGVAVIAKDTFSAIKGRRAVEASWDGGPEGTLDSGELLARYENLAKSDGKSVRLTGDPLKAKAEAQKVIASDYVLPFLAHAPMEPLNCTVDLRKDGCTLWTGTQMQTGDLYAAAKTAGLKPEEVLIHTTMAGGGFGRRASPVSDYVTEAVEVAKVSGGPVKVMWTREDDIKGGFYRPFSFNRMEAGLDSAGNPLFWTHRIVAQSILEGTSFEQSMVKDGVDVTSVEGAKSLPYAIPNVGVDLHTMKLRVPVLWWRSVGHSAQAFTTESFIDEVAHLAGKDPFEFRRKLLADHKRWENVLTLAAQKAGWGGSLPQGHARGIAVHESFGSFVAQVAEVSAEDKGRIRVHRVTVAVDCGVCVNPMTVEAQMQGGVAFGLTAALYGAVTFKEGRVVQSNFNNYKVLPFSEMPRVDVHIVKSSEKPGGIGEPGTPPIAPAVMNAVFALTGKRVRRLPFSGV